MRLETERLVLRELTNDDLAAWYAILSDAETMKHYPAPFDEEKVRQWLEWNLENYQNYGFGLWAVILKEENRLVTPHIAWAPKESRQRLMDIAVENLKAFLAGAPQNVVNA